MNKQLFARFLTLMLLAWGAIGVPLQAQEQSTGTTKPEDVQAHPLSISCDGNTLAECGSWDELKTVLKNNTEISYCDIDVWRDIDESFGQWELNQETLGGQLTEITINLHGSKIHGQGITASWGSVRLYIKDDTYKQVTYQETAPYTVTNPNPGGIILTAVPDANGNLVGGSIEVLGGAEVELQSGCVESTNKVCFVATGDVTGERNLTSTVYIYGGYLKGQEGCVYTKGSGAQTNISNNRWFQDTDGTKLVPVLEALDYAAVAGSSSNEEGKRYGGTITQLDECVIIGRSETEEYSALGVYHPQRGTLWIDKATIIAYDEQDAAVAVVMRGGTLYMYDGTIITNGTSQGGYVGEVDDYSCPSMGIMYDDVAGFYDTDNMQVYIYDGIFRGTGGGFGRLNEFTPLLPSQVINLRGGKYYEDKFPISDDNYYSHTVWVLSLYAADGYGGQIEKDEAADRYYFTFVPSEQAEVVIEEGVAFHFAHFSDLLQYYGLGGSFEQAPVVKLMSDFQTSSYDEVFTIKASDYNDDLSYFVLDLNGHTVSNDGRFVFRIAERTHLKLLDSQGGGVIKGPQYLCYLSPYSELVIESGEYQGFRLVALGESVYDSYYYDQDLGKLTILDGKFRVLFITNGEDLEDLIPRFDHCIRGGLYSEYIAQTYKIDPAFVLDENEDDVYHWRVSSAVKAVYGTTKTDVDRTDNTYTLWLDGEEGVLADRMAQLLVYNDQADVTMKVKKNFPTADTWCAFYAPFAIEATAELLQDFDFAKIWDTELIEGKTTIEFIQLNVGDKIPAFTPCLVRAKADGLQTMTFPNVNLGNTTDTRKPIDCSTVREKFTFTGVFENTGVHEKYVLNGAGALVYATNAAAKLSPMKWYMEKESKKSSTSPSTPEQVNIRVLEGETSGITDLSTPVLPTDGKVYTLQGAFIGTSLLGLPTGIYVQNGRKVVVK